MCCLNICVCPSTPNSCGETLLPRDDGIKRRAFGSYLGHECGALMNESRAPEEILKNLLTLNTIVTIYDYNLLGLSVVSSDNICG